MRFWYSIAVLITMSVTALAAFSASGAPEQGSPEPGSSSSAAQAAPLPKDVDPDSMSRLPVVKREDMDELGKKMYDLITSPQGGSLTGLRGPYGIWLYSPPVAEHAHPLNYYLRYKNILGRRLTELAILVTARQLDSQFEWSAHEPIALKEGLEQQIIDVVKYRKGLAGVGEKEAIIISFGRELFGKRKVSSPTFAHALKVFGKQAVVELAVLMGDYSSISSVINAFDLQMPRGQKPLLPLP